MNFIEREKKINTARVNAKNIEPNTYNPLYETTKTPNPGSLTKKNSSSMLFKTALETSNKKKTLRNHYDSDRTNDRQGSIGKLKEKLFGVKKVISQKDNTNTYPKMSDREQTNSFSIYTKKPSQESEEDSKVMKKGK